MAWGEKTKGSCSGKTWLGLFLVVVTGMETSSDEMEWEAGLPPVLRSYRSQEGKGRSYRAQVLRQNAGKTKSVLDQNIVLGS